VTLTLLDGADYDLKTYDPMLPSPIGGALAPTPATNAATVVIAPSA
jgi:hypothetical protein